MIIINSIYAETNKSNIIVTDRAYIEIIASVYGNGFSRGFSKDVGSVPINNHQAHYIVRKSGSISNEFLCRMSICLPVRTK